MINEKIDILYNENIELFVSVDSKHEKTIEELNALINKDGENRAEISKRIIKAYEDNYIEFSAAEEGVGIIELVKQKKELYELMNVHQINVLGFRTGV